MEGWECPHLLYDEIEMDRGASILGSLSMKCQLLTVFIKSFDRLVLFSSSSCIPGKSGYEVSFIEIVFIVNIIFGVSLFLEAKINLEAL